MLGETGEPCERLTADMKSPLARCDFAFPTALNTDMPDVGLFGGFRKSKQRIQVLDNTVPPLAALALPLAHRLRPKAASEVQYRTTRLSESRGLRGGSDWKREETAYVARIGEDKCTQNFSRNMMRSDTTGKISAIKG